MTRRLPRHLQTIRITSPPWGAVLAILLSAGCSVERQIHSAPRPDAPTQSPPAAPAETQSFLIQPGAAGPIRLGMRREEALKLPGFTVTSSTLRLEGAPVPVLRFERDRVVSAVAELSGGRITRIRVLSSQFRTPEGLGIGTSARELGQRYGTGKTLTGEGNVCAVFARAPGRSFCFRTTPELLVKPDWKKIARLNPTVEVVLVVPSR